MALFLTVAGLLLIGMVVEDRWSVRKVGRRAGIPPTSAVTVVSLTALATQIERLHVLNGAGLLSDLDLKQAELALLDAVPEI